MSVQLSPSLISSVEAANPFPNNPKTPEEWIIAAMNYLHSTPSGGGDIFADGSVPFTGQETFQAGIRLNNGTPAAVALGNSATNGLIFGVNTVSIVTNGVEKWMVNSSGSFNPILDNTYDIGNGAVNPRDITVSRNVVTDNIVEKTVGLGVTVTGTGGLTLAGNLGVGGVGAGADAAIKTVAATVTMAQINLPSSGAVVVAAPNSGDIYYSNSGFNFFDGTTLMSLLTNAGWTLPSGTASKAGFDADGAGFVNADQIAHAQTTKAIMDHLMTNMKLFTA